MADSPTLREATPADAPAIQEAAKRVFPPVFDDLLGEQRVRHIVEEWYDPERLVRDDVEPDDRPFFIAVAEDAVVGFVEGKPAEADDAAHLYRIYVVPEYWGEGVGAALLARLEATYREWGVDRLLVRVLADNDRAVSFYESTGFDHVGEIHNEQVDRTGYEYVKSLAS